MTIFLGLQVDWCLCGSTSPKASPGKVLVVSTFFVPTFFTVDSGSHLETYTPLHTPGPNALTNKRAYLKSPCTLDKYPAMECQDKAGALTRLPASTAPTRSQTQSNCCSSPARSLPFPGIFITRYPIRTTCSGT